MDTAKKNFKTLKAYSAHQASEFAHEKRLSLLNRDDQDAIMLLGRAINSPLRLELLRMLNDHPMSLTEIANAFNIHVSSAAVHIGILSDAELLSTDYATVRKGSTRYFCYNDTREITIKLREIFGDKRDQQTPVVYNINVGDYVDGKFSDLSCGFASETTHFVSNVSNDMFMPERHAAQILWTYDGYVTYAVPNGFIKTGNVDSVELKLEICAEAFGYNETYKSDISFFINDKRLCVYTSPGDFGARYGKFTPDWWYKESTKYGLLVSIAVTDKGVFLNGELVNKNITINDLNLSNGNRILLRIEVEENAKHKGGFNLFGEKFGDYDIPIVFTAYMKNNRR